jgi:UDP-glucose 4-epimerase
MTTILVTGGAGYVGSHCCAALAKAGHVVVAYDDLSNGHAEFVKWGALERGDVRDKTRLREVFSAHRPSAVVHCAALIEVGKSANDPGRFYDVNVAGTVAVLEAMRDSGCHTMVLSSTCATYGWPQSIPMDETHPQTPLSPYGWSKLLAERAVRESARSDQIRYALLRYFNAAGAAPDESIGERHHPESHALPLALFTLLGRQSRFKVFGGDYETRDGTCLRDYVHVLDLARAHVSALDQLMQGSPNFEINLGSGSGVTVLELLAVIERVTGQSVPHDIVARRTGDAPALLADNSLAQAALGWAPQHGIDEIVQSAWRWHADLEPRVFQ